MNISPAIRLALAIAAGVALAAALIGAVRLAVEERIIANQREAQERPLLATIAGIPHDNSLLDDPIPLDDKLLLGLSQPRPAYIARNRGEVVAVLLPVVASDGFAGPVELLVGVDRHGRVTGVHLLSHRETPGLGANIAPDRSNWLSHFIGKSLLAPPSEQWKPRPDDGDFDQITGATVTSRAATSAIHRALQYFERHRAQLLGNADE